MGESLLRYRVRGFVKVCQIGLLRKYFVSFKFNIKPIRAL